MKKLVAAVLTGVLVAGTLQHLQHLTQRSLRRQNHFLRKKDMTLRLLYLMIM